MLLDLQWSKWRRRADAFGPGALCGVRSLRSPGRYFGGQKLLHSLREQSGHFIS